MPEKYNFRTIAFLLLIALLSLVMHLRVFRLDLISMHVWRQTETQTVIQNFAREDMNILNPRFNNLGEGDGIFRREFPLMQWIIALSYKVLDESILLTRIMMYIFSMITMLGFYRLGQIFFRLKTSFSESNPVFLSGFSDWIAFIPAFFIVFSPTFFFFSVNPIPDIFALMCLSWGMVYFFKWYRSMEKFTLFLSLLFIMLSALVKLPFILFYALFFIPFLRDFRSGNRKIILLNWLPVLLSSVPVILWYASAIPTWEGNGIVKGITAVKGSGAWKNYFHLLQHNTISTLPELLTGYAALPFFLAGIYFSFYNRIFKKKEIQIILIPFILLVLYLLFELNMIGEAHDYYLFPFYPFIALTIAYGFREIVKQNRKVSVIALFVILLIPLTTYFRLKDRWNIEKPGFNKDLLTWKDQLRAAVPSDSLCIAGNDMSPFIMLYYIDKKGWTYAYQSLSPQQMTEMINRGARYFYSDSRNVDENPEIQSLIDRQICEYGSVKVFRLKEIEK
jgi:4-amino-4-deoxy-L-arabinose transferase-like glycosyltransferase